MTQISEESLNSQKISSSQSLKAKPSSLVIRPATHDDLAQVWVLAKTFEHTYLDDYLELKPESFLDALSRKELIVVADNNEIKAVLVFTGIKDDLYGYASILLWPSFIRQAIRQKIISKLLRYVFENWPVGKIKARPMETQKGAIKILKKLHFKHVGVSRNETKLNGEIIDRINFEMHRKFWDQWNK